MSKKQGWSPTITSQWGLVSRTHRRKRPDSKEWWLFGDQIFSSPLCQTTLWSPRTNVRILGFQVAVPIPGGPASELNNSWSLQGIKCWGQYGWPFLEPVAPNVGCRMLPEWWWWGWFVQLFRSTRQDNPPTKQEQHPNNDAKRQQNKTTTKKTHNNHYESLSILNPQGAPYQPLPTLTNHHQALPCARATTHESAPPQGETPPALSVPSRRRSAAPGQCSLA